MNDNFDFGRFGRHIRKFTKEHMYSYLLYAASFLGILFLFYGISVLNSLHHKFYSDTQMALFITGLILGGCLFSASFYSFFHNKAKGIQYLNIPSSHTEKIILGFIFTQVIFFLSFMVIFSLVDHMMCGFYNQFHKMPEQVPPEELQYYTAYPLDFSDETIKGSILVYMVLSSISHFGSLCFEKNAFVKTSLFVLLLGAALSYFNFYSMKAMIPEESMPGGKFFTVAVRLGTDTTEKGLITLPGQWENFMYWFLPGMLYVLFWMSSYYKHKEKQV